MKWYADSPTPRTTGFASDRSALARSYAAREFAATLAAAAALTNDFERTDRVSPSGDGDRDGHAAAISLQAAIGDMQCAMAELRRVEARCGTNETRTCLERMERSLQTMRGAVDHQTIGQQGPMLNVGPGARGGG